MHATCMTAMTVVVCNCYWCYQYIPPDRLFERDSISIIFPAICLPKPYKICNWKQQHVERPNCTGDVLRLSRITTTEQPAEQRDAFKCSKQHVASMRSNCRLTGAPLEAQVLSSRPHGIWRLFVRRVQVPSHGLPSTWMIGGVCNRHLDSRCPSSSPAWQEHARCC